MIIKRIIISPQYFENLLKSTHATGMVMVFADAVWVKAGRMTFADFNVLCTLLHQYWPHVVRRDQNRYISFVLNNKMNLLFAKALPREDLLLGMLFPLQTPLAQIRQETMIAIQTILNQVEVDPIYGLEQSLQLIPEPSSATDTDHPENLGDNRWLKETETNIKPDKDSQVPEKKKQLPDNRPSTVQEDHRHPRVYNPPGMNSVVSNSNPSDLWELDLNMEDSSWQPLEEFCQSAPRKNQQKQSDHSRQALQKNVNFDKQPSRKQEDNWQPLDEVSLADGDPASVLEDNFKLAHNPEAIDDISPPSQDIQLDLNHPTDEDDFFKNSLGEIDWSEGPLEQQVADITFYLVPALDNQFLLGDITQLLRLWLQEICETYAWQLDFISVRPDYLRWTLGDFPEALIREMLQIVRRKTSQKLFERIPELKNGNISGDFWSPGYLVDMQNREFSTHALKRHFSGR